MPTAASKTKAAASTTSRSFREAPVRQRSVVSGDARLQVSRGAVPRCSLGTMHHRAALWMFGLLAVGSACAGNDDTLVPVPESVRPNLIAAGFAHTCMLLEDGSPVCWGAGSIDDPSDQHPHFGQSIAPTTEKFSQIVAGDYHTCGLRTDGTVRCWGMPSAVSGTPPDSFIGISAGQNSTCGVAGDGARSCWGNTPVADSGDLHFTEFALGGAMNCGVLLDGSVHCWYGEQRWEDVPDNVQQIDAALECACGIDDARHVQCWGLECWGMTPPDAEIVQVAVGTQSGCGIATDQRLVCWGQWTAPTIGGVASVAAGTGHACARTEGHQAFCVGLDQAGETFPPPEWQASP